MLMVLAIGGNALLQPHEVLTADNLFNNARLAAEKIAPIIKNHEVIIVHGNGPQVGLLALQAEHYTNVPAYPFDVLVAESQGMIGYALQQAFKNVLPTHQVTALLTQVLVESDDPAFLSPTKPIGAFYSKNDYQNFYKQHPEWQFQETSEGFRRVVASPKPKVIVEVETIQQLLQRQSFVIAAGGGGIPCIKRNGKLEGVEAVIDKDLTASLLARALNADCLIILTNVDAIYQHWGMPEASPIVRISVNELSTLTFERGSMQPKVEAVCEFVNATKHNAMIGHLHELEKILVRQRGTHVIA